MALTCTICRGTDVFIARVDLRAVGAVIVAQCKSCQHCWEIDGETPLLRPKPDRRQEAS